MSQDNNKLTIRQLVTSMPMGDQQKNNLLYFVLDTWSDRVFMEGASYPAGYFAASTLNTSEEALKQMMDCYEPLTLFTGLILEDEIQRAKEFVPQTRAAAEKLINLLWEQEPFLRMDKTAELQSVDALISEKAIDDFSGPVPSLREYVLDYLRALAGTLWGLFTFVCVGRYFESGYIRRVKSRCETAFAIAAIECFNGDEFKTDLQEVQERSVQRFSVSPNVRTTNVFARNPKKEKEMVFVSRNIFERIIDFYSWDLFNGMHHGHAPCRCRHCKKYFLTETKHRVLYCDGISPEDSRYTCRQKGAAVHQKEADKNHPVKRIYKTRTNTIRQHWRRGKITKEFEEIALRIAEEHRDDALFDNEYAAAQYARDMAQAQLYEEVRRHMK